MKELRSASLDCDNVFSDYPLLVYNDKLIKKTNIAAFLRQLTTIDDKFSPRPGNSEGHNEKLKGDMDTITRLTDSLQQLHLITVSVCFLFHPI